MAIRWYKTKFTARIKGTPTQRYKARISVRGTKTEKDLAKDISNALSIEAPEANLLIDELANQILRAVLSGQSVKVDGLGTFSPKLKTKSTASADDVDSSNILGVGINFRMDPELKKQIESASLEEYKSLDRKHETTN